jgi:hypothetical protein
LAVLEGGKKIEGGVVEAFVSLQKGDSFSVVK